MLTVVSFYILILTFLGVWIVYGRRKAPCKESARTLIVLGSGGHTAEMLALLSKFPTDKYSPRQYVVAATDRMSAQKAHRFESSQKTSCSDQEGESRIATVHVIPRSREVGQSYLTSVGTTVVAIIAAFRVVLTAKPDLVLVNGPGTCIPICLAAVLCRIFRPWRGQITYIESIARVSSLSLSGKLLYQLRLADLFIVQWPKLQQQHKRAIYSGRLY